MHRTRPSGIGPKSPGNGRSSAAKSRRRSNGRAPVPLAANKLPCPEPRRPSLQQLLSPREWEIVILLNADKNCKEVAGTLGLSIRTVEHYVDRLKLRFGKRTLHGLVAHIAEITNGRTMGVSPG